MREGERERKSSFILKHTASQELVYIQPHLLPAVIPAMTHSVNEPVKSGEMN